MSTARRLTAVLPPAWTAWSLLMAGEPNIREVMAFPKSQQAADLMADAPSDVTDQQLADLHIKLDIQKK